MPRTHGAGEGYAGLDLGGTSAKAAVFDVSGRMLGFGKVCYEPNQTPEGYSEIPIEELREASRQALRAAVRASGVEIRALAVSSQGQTFTSLDSADRPLHPAIMWYDDRAARQAEKMRGQLASALESDAVPLIESISSAPKIVWLREHYPDCLSRAARYLLLPEYIAYQLTGEAVTDPITAASTGLFVENASDYCDQALESAGIDRAQLAAVARAGTPIAKVRPDAAADWGLGPNTIIVTGTNDQYAGALGAGNCRPGVVTETTGTCLALVTLVESVPKPLPPGLFSGAFPIPRYSFILAYLKTAGVVLDWFQREFCPGRTLGELDEAAASVPIGSGGLTFLPHFEGAVSPRPDAAAKGCVYGLTLASGLVSVYRAILESLSFCVRDCLELMELSGASVSLIRSIGGGAKSDLWLQMKADVTGLTLERPMVAEAATFGAAMLAMVGDGEFASVEECSGTLYRPEKVFAPDPTMRSDYEAAREAYRDLCAKVYG